MRLIKISEKVVFQVSSERLIIYKALIKLARHPSEEWKDRSMPLSLQHETFQIG